MYIVGFIILVFFAVVGISAFISAIIKSNMNSDTGDFILLIPQVDENNAEARIRSAGALFETERCFRVVCICEENTPARGICERLRKEYPFLEIVSKNEMM